MPVGMPPALGCTRTNLDAIFCLTEAVFVRRSGYRPQGGVAHTRWRPLIVLCRAVPDTVGRATAAHGYGSKEARAKDRRRGRQPRLACSASAVPAVVQLPWFVEG